MRLYAPLLITLLAVGARSASIPEKIQPELEKKLTDVDPKPPAENVSSEPELVDPVNTAIDVENNLRNNVKAEDIPVKVIVEDVQPIVKSPEIESVNEVLEEEIIRPLVDLRYPGPPQHQEHETQNPDHYEDMERTVSTVKEDIQETQAILRQGFQSVTDGIQNWYSNNEQINNLQNSINNLQESFAVQVQKLNDTLQNFLHPDNSKNIVTLEEEKATNTNLQNIEARLKTLDSNFKAGVEKLSNGVQVIATLREEGAPEPASTSSSTTTTAPPGLSNPFQFLVQLVGNLQSSMTSSLSNMTQAVNNFVTQNQPNITLPSLPNFFQPQSSTAAPLADAPVDGSTTVTTQRPSPWQNLQTSFNNLFNQNQPPQAAQNNQVTQAPTGTFSIPAFPIITSIVNLIQRPGAQSTEKPAEAPQASPAPAGSNAVPAPVQPEEIKLQAEKKPEPTTNPIKKILENSPVVQGINVAVQRIQSINRPEEPRDTTQKAAVATEPVKAEKVEAESVKAEELKPETENDDAKKDETEQEKGGLFYVLPPKHGSVGDNIDIDRVTSEKEEQKTPIVEEIKEEVKETEKVSDKTE